MYSRYAVAKEMLRGVVVVAVMLLVSACASYGVIHNQPESETARNGSYSIRAWPEEPADPDTLFTLNFSGGGTRAAAMAYGVLKKLRDTQVTTDGKTVRLLDKVSYINSVSGGSFTSAYYALYGDGIFENFEHDFLRKDVEKHLVMKLFNPFNWFRRTDRTEWAMKYYDKILFKGATFADMIHPDRPMVVINASDLAHGLRFSFIQGYFDLLCSDLMNFPVSAAVTASSAVPVVFKPVVLENYDDCQQPELPQWTLDKAKTNVELGVMVDSIESYADKKNRKYVHLVDGGITDNTGLRAVIDFVNLAGGPEALLGMSVKSNMKIPRRIVNIAVNASTEHRSDMDQSSKQPSALTALNAMSDVRLHRTNNVTIDDTRRAVQKWAESLSTPEHPVETYFIELSFRRVQNTGLRTILNAMPTSFSLSDEQVDTLISSAESLLDENLEFQRLVRDLGND